MGTLHSCWNQGVVGVPALAIGLRGKRRVIAWGQVHRLNDPTLNQRLFTGEPHRHILVLRQPRSFSTRIITFARNGTVLSGWWRIHSCRQKRLWSPLCARFVQNTRSAHIDHAVLSMFLAVQHCAPPLDIKTGAFWAAVVRATITTYDYHSAVGVLLAELCCAVALQRIARVCGARLVWATPTVYVYHSGMGVLLAKYRGFCALHVIAWACSARFVRANPSTYVYHPVFSMPLTMRRGLIPQQVVCCPHGAGHVWATLSADVHHSIVGMFPAVQRWLYAVYIIVRDCPARVMWAMLAGYVNHAVSSMPLTVSSRLAAFHVKSGKRLALLIQTTPHAREDVDRQNLQESQMIRTQLKLFCRCPAHTCCPRTWGKKREFGGLIKGCVRIYRFVWTQHTPTVKAWPWQIPRNFEQVQVRKMGPKY